jgi:hypothetical protein
LTTEILTDSHSLTQNMLFIIANGSGKTLLVRKILENLPKFTRSIVVPESELNFRDFISFIHEALVGGTLGKSDSVKVREIRNQLLLHADKKQLDFLIVDTSSPPRKFSSDSGTTIERVNFGKFSRIFLTSSVLPEPLSPVRITKFLSCDSPSTIPSRACQYDAVK